MPARTDQNPTRSPDSESRLGVPTQSPDSESEIRNQEITTTAPSVHSIMTSPSESPPPSTPTFRSTLIRVMAVQVGALLLLWLLQSHYTG